MFLDPGLEPLDEARRRRRTRVRTDQFQEQKYAIMGIRLRLVQPQREAPSFLLSAFQVVEVEEVEADLRRG